MKHFNLNQFVKVNPNNDNENYDSFREKTLVISKVAKNAQEHPGYDQSLSPQYLYDIKTKNGELIPFSLYDYELIPTNH